ncbi:unnamed protein product [Adineta steineri]|uniref:Uncharacterized protein n=1 Tax=Adineta steineri TaxID=433720 RepID=A0A814X2I2_9BILA|nr:unnamed protein product [Adineta steineri]CAF1485408.1 unnamed protein product [Adineta steineri]
MHILDKDYTAKDPSKDKTCGHAGLCVLRELTYFDIGESFWFDSLHGLYSGVFKEEFAKAARIVEAELAQSQMAVRAATTDGERQQRGGVVNMKMGDVLDTHKEWRGEREKDG